MTGTLYAITRWILSVLPVDPSGRRCFDETLADWRAEAAGTSGTWAAVQLTGRALMSVLSCVSMVCFRQAGSAAGTAILRRLATWSLVSGILFALNLTQAIVGPAYRLPADPITAGLLSVTWIAAVMPLMAFASAAWGRWQNTPTPYLGPALVACAAMFVLMGWLQPASSQAFRELQFAMTSAGATIPPGIPERSILELTGLLFTDQFPMAAEALTTRMIFVVSVPVLLVLGAMARTLQGSRRVAGTVLPLLVFALPMLARVHYHYVLALMWPSLIGAALVTRALVRSAARERSELTGTTA